MIFIASNEKEGNRTGLKDIIKALGSPEAFTAKILQQLVKGKLLDSFRGPTGGFVLTKDREIKIMDVVTVIDGDGIISNCVLGFANCSNDNPCPVHHKFVVVRENLKNALLSTNIADSELVKANMKLMQK